MKPVIVSDVGPIVALGKYMAAWEGKTKRYAVKLKDGYHFGGFSTVMASVIEVWELADGEDVPSGYEKLIAFIK